jgi:large repetitive protein
MEHRNAAAFRSFGRYGSHARFLMWMVFSLQALLVAATTHAADVLIVGSNPELGNVLKGHHEAMGNTVTQTSDASGDLSNFRQVWDIDLPNFDNATTSGVIPTARIATYLQYLEDGGSLFLMGELSFMTGRNNSVKSAIDAFGGGTFRLNNGSDPIPNNFQTVSIAAPFNATLAVGTVELCAMGWFGGTGSGTPFITGSNSVGQGVTVGVHWGRGSLSEAPAGELVVVMDSNLFGPAQVSTYDGGGNPITKTCGYASLSRNIIRVMNIDPKPLEPSELSVGFSDIGVLDFSFKRSAFAQNYTVTITPPGTTTTITPTDLKATPIETQFTGLTAGTTYTIEVYASNAVGDSDVESISAKALGVPPAPIITTSSEDDREVTFSWSPVTSGSAAAGYGEPTVEYRQTSPTSGTWTTATTNSATISGLTNGTATTFEVRVSNEVATSDVATITLTPRTTPDAPASITLTPRYRELDVAWTAPDFDGGAAISGYEVRYRAGTTGTFTAGTATCSGTLPTTTLACTLAPLADATSYQVHVLAVNEAGEGEAAEDSAETASKVVIDDESDRDIIAGETFSVQVRIQNTDGDVADEVTVTAALAGANAADATLSGTLTQSTNAQGIASFTGLSIDGDADLEGTDYTLRFTVTGLTAADHVVNVMPGDPVAVSIDTVNVQQLRNIPFDVVVRLRDEFDNETTARSAVTVTLSGAGGAEAGNARMAGYPLPTSNPQGNITQGSSNVEFEGVVYTGLSSPTGSDVILTATVSGLTAGSSNALSVRAIDIAIDAADDFILADGEDSTTVSFTVTRASDDSGVADQTIWFVTTGGSIGEDGLEATAVTNASGVATITLTSSTTVGPVTITGYCPGDCSADVIVDFAQRPDAPEVAGGAVTIVELDESAEVTFTPLSDDPATIGYAPVTHYEYSVDQGDSWVRVELDENPFTIPDLTNGTEYDTVWFRARNDASSVGTDAYVVLPPFTPYHYPSAGLVSGEVVVEDRTVRLPIAWDDNGREITALEVMLRRDGDDEEPFRYSFTPAEFVNADGDPFVTGDDPPFLQIEELYWSAEFTAQVRVLNLRGWSLDWPVDSDWVDPACPTASAICFDGVSEGSTEGVTLTTSFLTRPGPVVMQRVAADVSDGDRAVTFTLAPHPESGMLVSGYRFAAKYEDEEERSSDEDVPLGEADPLDPGTVTITKDDFGVAAEAFRNGIDTTLHVWAIYEVPNEETILVGDEETLDFDPYHYPSIGIGGGNPILVYVDAGLPTALQPTVRIPVTWDANGRDVTRFEVMLRRDGDGAAPARYLIDVANLVNAEGVAFEPLTDTQAYLQIDGLFWSAEFTAQVRAENLRGWGLDWPEATAWVDPSCPTASAICFDAVTEGSPEGVTLTSSFITRPGPVVLARVADDVSDGDRTVTFTLAPNPNSGVLVSGYRFQSIHGPVSSPRSGVNVVPLGAATPLAPGQITLTPAEFTIPDQAFRNGVPTTLFVWAYHTVPATGEGDDVTAAFDLEGDERTLPFNPYGLASVGFQPATLTGEGATRMVTLVVDENGRPVTNVIATAREHGTNVITWRNATTTGSDTTRVLTLTELRYATRYEWLLQAENLRGTSLLPTWLNPNCPSDATAICPTTPKIAFTTIPDAPIVQANYGDTTITLTLGAPSDSGPVIDTYAYSLSTDDGVTWTDFTPFDPPAIHTPEPVTATIAGLTNGTTYRVRVHAINEVGAGAPGYPVGDVMPRTTPDAATNVFVTAGDTILSVAWNEPYDGGLPITGYEFSIDDDTWQPFDPGITSSPGIITNLTNGVTYPVRIRAVNDEGHGTASTPSVPGTPFANLGAIGTITVFTGNAQAWLWYDPVPNAIRYELSLDGGAWVNRNQERPMHLTNLTNAQTYTARIRPIGDTGPGRASNEVTFTPTGPAPIPDADIKIDPPAETPAVAIDREGFGELTFAFILENTRDEFLPNVWLHPRNLPEGAEILRMVPERGTLTLLPTGQWYWEGVNLEFEGDTATILITIKDQYDAPCGSRERKTPC